MGIYSIKSCQPNHKFKVNWNVHQTEVNKQLTYTWNEIGQIIKQSSQTLQRAQQITLKREHPKSNFKTYNED